jgi:hypothetical protein
MENKIVLVIQVVFDEYVYCSGNDIAEKLLPIFHGAYLFSV